MLVRVLALVTIIYSSGVLAQSAESARYVFFPSITLHKETGVVAGDRTSFRADIRAGYINTSSWYFGMIYSDAKSGGSNGMTQTGIGNSVGYFLGAAGVIGSYYLKSHQSEDASAGTIRREEGSGFQVDLIYSFPIFGSISLSPMLSYKTLTHKKKTQNDVVTGESHNETFIYPFIGLLMSW